MVYIFSAIVTGFQGTLLAGLLLAFGVLAVVGNVISGPLTDRYGSFRVGVGFMILQVAALGSVALVHGNFAGLTVAFLFWGFAAFGSGVPVQHRLIAVDPRQASTAISWYSTALYLDVSVAPLLGAAALTAGSLALIPAAGALVTLLGLGTFLLGFRSPRTGSHHPRTVNDASRNVRNRSWVPVTSPTIVKGIPASSRASGRSRSGLG
ncbi:MFS transporter [Microbacterium sp. 22303]|uniref:MFS transporter n=1 Tax=Microbacterium sp. 22303 TaxID=3453905 RepID=UPI003F83ECD3